MTNHIEVINAASKVYGVDVDDIVGRSCQGRFARPRHVVMFICYDMLGLSYPDIGRIFDRDHTSVIDAKNKIDELRKIDPVLNNNILRIENESGITPDCVQNYAELVRRRETAKTEEAEAASMAVKTLANRVSKEAMKLADDDPKKFIETLAAAFGVDA